MPGLQELAKKEGCLTGGHRMCAGCTAPIIARLLGRVTDHEIVVCSATGCLEVATTVFPYSAWKVPWLHTAFENVSAMASGVEAMYNVRKKLGELDKNVKVIATGGDGGTYDIGLQSLSAAVERGHDFLYVCYDNEAYMNTGIQRSSATPTGAATTTTPVGTESSGKPQRRKDLTSVLVGHHIAYAAQASVHDPVDLSNKLQKGLALDGPAFVNVIAPCVPGWRISPDQAVESARQAVETRFWPVYEVEHGKYKINYKPKEEISVEQWLFSQGRFKHLKSDKNKAVVAEIQQQVDDQWNWLLEREAHSSQ